MERHKLAAGKVFERLAAVILKLGELFVKGFKIHGELVRIFRILRAQLLRGKLCRLLIAHGVEPPVRICAVFSGQCIQIPRNVDARFPAQHIFHEILQPQTTFQHETRLLNHFHLGNRERVVMQARDGLGDQKPHRKACPVSKRAGELIDRLRCGKNICFWISFKVCIFCTAGKTEYQQRRQQQRNPSFVHKKPLSA